MHQMSRVSLAALALLAAIAGCAKGDRDAAATGDSAGGAAAPAAAPAGATSADADLADLSRYRLTMDKVDRFYAAQHNVYTKVKNMSPAEREALAKTYEGSSNANASLDDMVRNVERIPEYRDAVRQAGLSPREYIMVTMAMMQSMMASSVLQMRPNDNQDSLAREMKVHPDNIKFIREHQAEITQKQKAMEAQMKQLEATKGG